ncbi:MAG: hypothetical protein KAT88_04805 [Spirochaetes bacterium]|nr:hypothetical protein [Spirochaetota bacterium]
MKVSGWLMHLAARALAESMDVRTMTHLVRRLLRNYDLSKSSGFRQNVPIPNKTAAKQIVKDIRDSELFLPFIDLLIKIGHAGLMGRRYRVPHLREILSEIKKAGFLYDEEFEMFVEDPRVRRTKNWGVLREGEEYVLTFLCIDIVGNSDLVRKYPDEIIKSTYTDLRNIVQNAGEKRNGRIWNWEGDGGLAAFYFSQKNNSAVLSAMEIIHELFIYNMVGCRMDERLRVRIAVHSGPCQYRHNFEDITSDTIKKIVEIESKHTKPDNVTFSSSAYLTLDHILTEQLKPFKAGGAQSLYRYELLWEQEPVR